MEETQLIRRLAEAIQQATRSAKFCIGGEFPRVSPEIHISGVGRVAVPLKPAQVKGIIPRCRIAPYGQGTKTLVDTEVRNSYELDPGEFQLGEAWNAAIAETTRHVASELGISPDALEAQIYKLLIYERGGFFLPHRDSEKCDGMVASLVVVLPNSFDGGELLVRHGIAEQKFSFNEAAQGRAPSYAAFFADCEHEVRRVGRGRRLCLTYNLVLKPSPESKRKQPRPDDPTEPLLESIRSWTAQRPGVPLVFALDHYYTEHGLSQDLLKGGDRTLADLLSQAAEKTNCRLQLAQVTRHLQQWADDGSFDRWERRWARNAPSAKRALEIGETYADDLQGMQWSDLDGTKQPWGEIKFDLTAIVSSTPINDWKPTSQEFEGYTGNAGNTLDRWYHRSAIVLWRRDHHFDVLAAMGLEATVPLLASMLAKLNKLPKRQQEAAHDDGVRFAQAMIARWPRDFGRYDPRSAGKSDVKDFPKLLLKLHDRDAISSFLLKLADEDHSLPIGSLIVSSCREFGWTAFAVELKQLLTAPALVAWQHGIRLRDVQWLSAYCCEQVNDAGKLSLGRELCALAVDRFCQPPSQPTRNSWANFRREPTETEAELLPLLQSLLSTQCADELQRLIAFVQARPDDFDLDICLVPCLKEVIPWASQQCGVIPTPLRDWLNSVRQHLAAATASPPQPPTDLARPAPVTCACRYCAQLNSFLSDPLQDVGRIPAREDIRQHVIGEISRHQCDVKHTLDRHGSPYSLVLTKTTGSFERAVKRYDANVRLLEALPSLVDGGAEKSPLEGEVSGQGNP